jgi:hypothetical protein
MAADKRGIWVDMGGGADTVKVSPYGDNFNIYGGTDIKKIDGGDNEGSTPWGDKAKDSIDVFIKIDAADYSNTTVIDTLVSTITVSAIASTNAEAANGYTHVLKRGDTVLAYLKNVEQVNVQIWKDFNNDSKVQWDADPAKNESKWAKNFQLSVNVREIRLNPTDNTKTDWGINLSDAYHFAWINGTLSADTITADSLVSDRTKALMLANKRGLWVDAGAGNDTITGGTGSDNLGGNAGSDSFVDLSTADGCDTILDFTTTEDKLALTSAGFAGAAAAGTSANVAAFNVIQATAASKLPMIATPQPMI